MGAAGSAWVVPHLSAQESWAWGLEGSTESPVSLLGFPGFDSCSLSGCILHPLRKCSPGSDPGLAAPPWSSAEKLQQPGRVSGLPQSGACPC